jgi:hypothetical protein
MCQWLLNEIAKWEPCFYHVKFVRFLKTNCAVAEIWEDETNKDWEWHLTRHRLLKWANEVICSTQMSLSAQLGQMRSSAQLGQICSTRADEVVCSTRADLLNSGRSAQLGQMRSSAQLRQMRLSAQLWQMRLSAQLGQIWGRLLNSGRWGRLLNSGLWGHLLNSGRWGRLQLTSGVEWIFLLLFIIMITNNPCIAMTIKCGGAELMDAHSRPSILKD